MGERAFHTSRWQPEFPGRIGLPGDAFALSKASSTVTNWNDVLAASARRSRIGSATGPPPTSSITARFDVASDQSPQRTVREPPGPAPLPVAVRIDPSRTGLPEDCENFHRVTFTVA